MDERTPQSIGVAELAKLVNAHNQWLEGVNKELPQQFALSAMADVYTEDELR